LKKEFLIEETWVSFQLRPWTPPEGIPFTVLFPGVDIKERYASLNRAGAFFGYRFGERTFLSNSKPALEASEYARDKGKYDSFHEHVFRAYFTDLLDIGDAGILLKLAQEVGLDSGELQRSLDDGLYRTRIEEAMRDAAQCGVTAVPTFIIDEAHKIVGAQPLGAFRDQLRRIHGAEK
jgi:predicted DsbA family dithiol-disulfide isomerase